MAGLVWHVTCNNANQKPANGGRFQDKGVRAGVLFARGPDTFFYGPWVPLPARIDDLNDRG